MKSRLTIEVNFDEGNIPVIQVISEYSDDVRDKLIANFLQSLSHTSRWCKILYMGNRSTDANVVRDKWHIMPMIPDEIPQEIELMKGIYENYKKPYTENAK